MIGSLIETGDVDGENGLGDSNIGGGIILKCIF